jgi:hypothetical protein
MRVACSHLSKRRAQRAPATGAQDSILAGMALRATEFS